MTKQLFDIHQQVNKGDHATVGIRLADHTFFECGAVVQELDDDKLALELLEALLDGAVARRVVLEVTEHANVDDYEALCVRLDRLRERGVRLAVDDAGAEARPRRPAPLIAAREPPVGSGSPHVKELTASQQAGAAPCMHQNWTGALSRPHGHVGHQRCTQMQRSATEGARGTRGFTLIEVMITVAIVAILAAVAVPQYTRYIQRGNLVEATNALAEYRVRMEQFYQDNGSYGAGGFAPVLRLGGVRLGARGEVGDLSVTEVE